MKKNNVISGKFSAEALTIGGNKVVDPDGKLSKCKDGEPLIVLTNKDGKVVVVNRYTGYFNGQNGEGVILGHARVIETGEKLTKVSVKTGFKTEDKDFEKWYRVNSWNAEFEKLGISKNSFGSFYVKERKFVGSDGTEKTAFDLLEFEPVEA